MASSAIFIAKLWEELWEELWTLADDLIMHWFSNHTLRDELSSPHGVVLAS